MITKTGNLLVKTAIADIAGGIYGSVRAADLTKKQRSKLIAEYGLDDDASLGWRNFGRGYLGAAAGGLGGYAAGGLIGALSGSPVIRADLGVIGGLGGAYYGAEKATRKYSKDNPILNG